MGTRERLSRLEAEAGPQEPAPEPGMAYEDLVKLPAATLRLLCDLYLARQPGPDVAELRKLDLDTLHRMYCETLRDGHLEPPGAT
jgi:hypothetical protein